MDPYYLITAGCNSFPGIPGHDLRGCIADAHRMHATLTKAFGDPVRYRILEDPTRAEFVQALQTALAMAQDGEVEEVLFSVSTHGTVVSANDPENSCTALVFSDATPNGWGLLVDWQLKSILDGFPVGCRVEGWFDSCHSGTISRGIADHPRPRSIPASVFAPLQRERIRKGGNIHTRSLTSPDGLGSNMAFWGACLDAEESADAPDGAGGFCGAFTRAWCDEFEWNANTSRFRLLPLVAKALARSGFVNQHPTLSAQRSGGA